MRLSILGPNGTGELPVRTAFEIGPGDTFAALVLVYALAYLYLLEPAGIGNERKRQLRSMLIGVALPLIVAFACALLFTIFNRGLLLVAPVR